MGNVQNNLPERDVSLHSPKTLAISWHISRAMGLVRGWQCAGARRHGAGAAAQPVGVGLKHSAAPGDRSPDTPAIKLVCSAGICLVFTNYIALVNSAEDSVIRHDLGTAFLCSEEISSASKWKPSFCFLFTASTLEKAVVSGIYSVPGSCSPCLCVQLDSQVRAP